MNEVKLFLDPRGRIARGTFWIGFAIVMVVSFGLGMLGRVGDIIGLLILWPQIVLHIKRLHDLGLNGFVLLAPFAVSVVCMTLVVLNGGEKMLESATPFDPRVMTPDALPYFEAAFAVGLAFLLWLGLSPGQKAQNRFGDVPA